jgi:serine/threonine-protein kinase
MTVDDFSQIALGSVLVGKYRISREIGRGGMAAVYEAENLGLGKRVAVKVLSAELTTSRVVRERFMREARASAAVRSPYICDVYDVGEFDNRPFLVMELLEGESLYDRMTRLRRLDVPSTLKIMTQTAKGLAKAHSAGIVHRDLKPENLFLTRNEEGEVITKLLDFGLAKFYATTDGPAQARLTREGALFGTPAYMSPEQAKGRGEVDHRSDLWALGCITYECLTGHTVWNVDQGVAMILAQVANAQIPLPSKLRPDLPPAFDKWLLKALQRAPEDRFQTAAQFMIALTEVLSPGDASHIQTPSLLVDVDDMLQRAADRRVPGDGSVETSVPDHFDDRTSEPSSRRPQVQPAAEHPRAKALEAAKLPKLIGSAPPRFRSRKGPILIASAAIVLLGASAAFLFRDSIAALFGGTSTARGSQDPSALSPIGQSAPLETQGFGGTITGAQAALLEGKYEESIRLLDDAIKNGGEGIATNLRTHVKAAQETPSAPCHLLALGRPRPFTANDPPSRPTIVASGSHAVVGWVDGHEDKTRRQVYTTVLDEAQRRIAVPQLATPETMNARYPQFWKLDYGTPTTPGVALIFWDATSRQAGIFARKLDAAGRIQGGLKNIAPLSKDEYAPAIVRTQDGSYWVAWEDDGSDGAQNLLIRHLTTDFDPTGPVVSLTALKPDRALRPSAVRPAISVSNGKLRVLFTLRQGQQRRVYSLVLDESSELLRTVTTPKISTNTTTLDHRFLAPLEALGREGTASDDARTHCLKDTCFVLWGEETAGIVAMALDARSNAVLYRHEIAPRGARPAIGANEKQLLAAFYESSRLRVSLLDRAGVGSVATIGKVSGIQPLPDVSATPRPDRWLVAWRDYEAGHFEAMAATISCQPAAAPR